MPVYNDWVAAGKLVNNITHMAGDTGLDPFFVLVNDGSHEEPPSGLVSRKDVEIVNLFRNVGHQRAIAIGLSWVYECGKIHEGVVVMDADGEDKPESIPELVSMAGKNPGNIIFAGRHKRRESLLFRLNYYLYRMFFRLLTGNTISFGNFCFIPVNRLGQVVVIPEIWNHYTGGVLRSRLPIKVIPLQRGDRITGKSKMSFVGLVMHGLSAISVYIDVVAVRLLITFIFLSLVAFAGLLIVIAIKYFTSLAIPGWATTASSGLILILLMALLISLFLSFIALNYRSQPAIVPLKHYRDFVVNPNSPVDENS